MDANNLCSIYPSVVGTRLDDCHTCHTGEMENGQLASNACDYCHKLMLDETGHTFMETLNPFGLDYYNAGRDKEALMATTCDSQIAGNQVYWFFSSKCLTKLVFRVEIGDGAVAQISNLAYPVA